MGDIKLQIGCLAVVCYLSIMYIKETTRGDVECNRFFDVLIAVTPWAITFDAASAYTVNHLETVPLWANRLIHLFFYLLLESILVISSLYLYDNLIGFKHNLRGKMIMTIPGVISTILILIGIKDVQFLRGTITNYSHGFSVYVCFIAVALYYGYIIYLILSRRSHLPKDKRIGAISFIALIGVLLLIQLLIPQFLLTSMCTTIMLLGIYIVFENPSIRRLQIQNDKMIDSFATLVENRDSNTGGHIKRTRMYVNIILNKMRKNDEYREILTKDYMKDIIEAAPLHDIGKISTPDSILQKPGKLDDEEYEIMKRHAACGGDIIMNTFIDMNTPDAKKVAYEVARYHHEKYNGKGYPEGIAGEDIPLHARIMAIADVFDAVSQKRCYRDAMPLDQCFSIIENGAGSDFDPKLVKLFLEARDEVSNLCEKYRDQ